MFEMTRYITSEANSIMTDDGRHCTRFPSEIEVNPINQSLGLALQPPQQVALFES